MEKQTKKKLLVSYRSQNRILKYKNFQKLKKKFKRLRKIYVRSNFSFNFYLRKALFLFKLNLHNPKKILIRLTQNNVFCTLLNKKNKTLVTSSSGKYKIKTSKKTLKFSSKVILNSFLYEIKKRITKNKLLIILIAPKFLRKKIVKQLKLKIKNKNIFIQISHKKAFNGCRPKKQKRKKRKGFRIFK